MVESLMNFASNGEKASTYLYHHTGTPSRSNTMTYGASVSM